MKYIQRMLVMLTVLAMTLAPVGGSAWAAGYPGAEPSVTAPAAHHILMAQADEYSDENSSETPLARALAGAHPTEEHHRRRLTPNKLHQYLGIGALLLGTATALSFGLADENQNAGGENSGGAHGALAVAASSLAAGAVATGFMYHHEDVGFDEPIKEPDNMHMLLTLMGTAGFIAATALQGDGGHSTFGVLGGVAMLAGVKIEW